MTASASRATTGNAKTRQRARSRARVLDGLRADRRRLEWLLTASRHETAHCLSGITLGYLSTREEFDEAMTPSASAADEV
jgi:hypothetical protein